MLAPISTPSIRHQSLPNITVIESRTNISASTITCSDEPESSCFLIDIICSIFKLLFCCCSSESSDAPSTESPVDSVPTADRVSTPTPTAPTPVQNRVPVPASIEPLVDSAPTADRVSTPTPTTSTSVQNRVSVSTPIEPPVDPPSAKGSELENYVRQIKQESNNRPLFELDELLTNMFSWPWSWSKVTEEEWGELRSEQKESITKERESWLKYTQNWIERLSSEDRESIVRELSNPSLLLDNPAHEDVLFAVSRVKERVQEKLLGEYIQVSGHFVTTCSVDELFSCFASFPAFDRGCMLKDYPDLLENKESQKEALNKLRVSHEVLGGLFNFYFAERSEISSFESVVALAARYQGSSIVPQLSEKWSEVRGDLSEATEHEDFFKRVTLKEGCSDEIREWFEQANLEMSRFNDVALQAAMVFVEKFFDENVMPLLLEAQD